MLSKALKIGGPPALVEQDTNALSLRIRARARLRALLSVLPLGASAGAVLGVALGGAFLAGGMAKDAVVHSQVSKIAADLNDGLSERSLETMIRNDPSALSLALRYDRAAPSTGTRQEAQLAVALDTIAQQRNLRRAAVLIRPAAAQPWNASPLDQARQLDCLAEAVYYEARGETPGGQAAVAQVVLNRVRHPAFPKSVCAVVYQGAASHRCQFSFACNGATRASREDGAWTRARRVAERALGGYVMADVGVATHFHLTSVGPGWKNMVRTAQIGSHLFYRFGGKAGAPGAFTGVPTEEPEALLALIESMPADGGVVVDIPAPAAAAPKAAPLTKAAPTPISQAAPTTPSA